MFAAVLRELIIAGPAQFPILEEDLSARGNVEPAHDVEHGGLAAAGRTQQHQKFSTIELETHAAQRLHFDLPHLIHLGERRGREDGSVVWVHRLTLPGLGLAEQQWHFAPSQEGVDDGAFQPCRWPGAQFAAKNHSRRLHGVGYTLGAQAATTLD